MCSIKLQRILDIIYFTLILSWSITSITLTVIMLTKNQIMDGSFKSLLDNWNSDIITDL
jgi:hypothetical protein